MDGEGEGWEEHEEGLRYTSICSLLEIVLVRYQVPQAALSPISHGNGGAHSKISVQLVGSALQGGHWQ